MVDFPFKQSPVVNALVYPNGLRPEYIPPAVYSQEQIGQFSEQMHAEFNARTAAAKVIYSAVSGWVGWEVKDGDWLPVVRDGKQVGRLGIFLPREPIDVVLNSATVPTVPDLKAERDRLQALIAAMRAVQAAAAEFSLREQIGLDATWPEKTHHGAEPVDLIHAVGVWKSLSISVHGVIFNSEKRLTQVEDELSKQGKVSGRPPNRPVYEVAREFAFLYARVTGKIPTYSKDSNGYSGEFSPALDALTRALGWQGRHLRQPGETAVKSVTPEVIREVEPALTGLLGGLLPVPK